MHDSTNTEIAVAAYDANSAVIVHEGMAVIDQIDATNPNSVELVWNEGGCEVIKDDGNSLNDILATGMQNGYHL